MDTGNPGNRIFFLRLVGIDGVERRRYLRCPTRIRSQQDWADSLEGVQQRLASLLVDGTLSRASISLVRPERIAAIRHLTARATQALPEVFA